MKINNKQTNKQTNKQKTLHNYANLVSSFKLLMKILHRILKTDSGFDMARKANLPTKVPLLHQNTMSVLMFNIMNWSFVANGEKLLFFHI